MATAVRVEAAVPGRRGAGTVDHELHVDLPVDVEVPLRDLIGAVVRAEVLAFRHRTERERFVRVLTDRTLSGSVEAGAVRSGGGEPPGDVDADDAAATALLAFQDGVYKVVVDDEPVDSLDATVRLTGASRLLFLRLVALAGG